MELMPTSQILQWILNLWKLEDVFILLLWLSKTLVLSAFFGCSKILCLVISYRVSTGHLTVDKMMGTKEM